jgi:hypothetical protein
MADDEQANRQTDRSQVEIKKSWLMNCDLRILDDEVVAWGRFNAPKIPESADDIEFTINRRMRPEQIAKKFYGRYELWWVIAIANGVRLPILGFQPGQTIIVPDPAMVAERVEGGEEF